MISLSFINFFMWSLSSPPSSSSSLCHCCMVTQTLQRCYIWMIRRMSHTHIRRRPSLETFLCLFLHLKAQTQSLQTDLSSLFIGLGRQRVVTVRVSNTQFLAPLCTSTRLKQAYFNGLIFTPPWPPLHALPVNPSVCCSSSSHSFCPSVSLLSFCSIRIGRHGVWNHSYT